MIMQKGLTCCFKGVFIVGDGIHTRVELYEQKMNLDDTKDDTKTNIPASEVALELEPKPKAKKSKAKKKKG